MKLWNLVAAGLVVLMSAFTAAPAAARSHVLTLHPKWHRTDYFGGVQTSGPWDFFGTETSRSVGTAVNEQTGAKRSVAVLPGCSESPALSGSSLLFQCGDELTIFSLATGATDSISLNPRLTSWAADCQDNLNYDEEYSCGLGPTAIGTDWVEFDEYCSEHCLEGPLPRPDTYFFQNRGTGTLRADPTGGSTYADLNTPDLARTLCSPLRIPRVAEAFVDGYGNEEPGLGSVGLDGSFAVVAGGKFGDAYDLEKCGSKLREPLPTIDYPPPAYNAHMVLWEIRDELRSRCPGGEFDGLFLPDRRRFALCVPGALFSAIAGYPNEIVLGQRTLFVGDQDGPLWEAPSPAEPR